MKNTVTLAKIVTDIIQTRSNGIRHVEIVQEVLNRGIGYEGKEGISAGIHSILKNLISRGEIVRNQDEMERNYTKSASKKRELAPTG